MICGFIPWVDLGIIDPDIADAGTHWSAFLTGNCFGYWWFSDGTTWFLLMSIIIAIVAKMSEKEYVNNFIAGAGGMMSVVLVIAVARGAKVIMASTAVDAMITLAPRATAITRTTDIMPPAPAMKLLTYSFSDIFATIAMMIDINKNQVVPSENHQ